MRSSLFGVMVGAIVSMCVMASQASATHFIRSTIVVAPFVPQTIVAAPVVVAAPVIQQRVLHQAYVQPVQVQAVQVQAVQAFHSAAVIANPFAILSRVQRVAVVQRPVAVRQRVVIRR